MSWPSPARPTARSGSGRMGRASSCYGGTGEWGMGEDPFVIRYVEAFHLLGLRARVRVRPARAGLVWDRGERLGALDRRREDVAELEFRQLGPSGVRRADGIVIRGTPPTLRRRTGSRSPGRWSDVAGNHDSGRALRQTDPDDRVCCRSGPGRVGDYPPRLTIVPGDLDPSPSQCRVSPRITIPSGATYCHSGRAGGTPSSATSSAVGREPQPFPTVPYQTCRAGRPERVHEVRRRWNASTYRMTNGSSPIPIPLSRP